MVLKSALCEDSNTNGGLSISQHLESVFFTYIHVDSWGKQKYQSHVNTDEILPILYLPALQHLSICIDNPKIFDWSTQSPPTLSTLVSLDLRYLRENHLHRILSLTTGLKKLKWSWFWKEKVAIHDHHQSLTFVIDLDKITAALLCVKDMLIDLTLATDLCLLEDDDINHYPKINESLSGISSFHQLKRFAVPHVLLNGRYEAPMVGSLAQILPINLETLYINDGLVEEDSYMLEPSDLGEPIREWFSCGKDGTPQLKMVSFWATEEDWILETRREFTEIGDEAGGSLSFAIVPWVVSRGSKNPAEWES
jgi:hypothetical protein